MTTTVRYRWMCGRHQMVCREHAMGTLLRCPAEKQSAIILSVIRISPVHVIRYDVMSMNLIIVELSYPQRFQTGKDGTFNIVGIQRRGMLAKKLHFLRILSWRLLHQLGFYRIMRGVRVGVAEEMQIHPLFLMSREMSK